MAVELREYIRVLRKRWRIVALLALVGLGAAALGSLLGTPQYQARTRLFVSTQAAGNASDLLQGSNFTQQRVKSYADVVTSPRVLQPVIDALRLDMTTDKLAEHIKVQVPLDTVLINVTVIDESPEQAAVIANAVGESFMNAVSELEQPTATGASPVRLSTVEPAEVPAAPVSPNTLLNLALGATVGLTIGVGSAVVREKLDTTIRGEADVEQVSNATILGGIAFDPEAPKRPLIVQTDPHSTRAEAFRQIRTNLQFVDVTNHSRSILLTSTLPGEGKSTTTANLAITLAAAGSRVCLVEADLRRPKVAEYMGVEGSVGLTTVLIGRADLEDVVLPWGNGNLHVLPSGQIPPNPSELLGSQAMDDLLRKLEASYDSVIIDAPPLLPVTDAAVLSKMVGGTVMVVGSGQIDKPQLEKAFEHLATVGARVIGVIMNLLPTKGPDAYTYYGYAHEYGPLQDDSALAHRKR